MKKLLLILILTFSFQILLKADDIKEFTIEEMSIGDSLLDYENLNTIKDSRHYTYNDNEFYSIDLILDRFKEYYAVQVHLKTNDKKYIIYGLGGAIKYGEPGVYYPQSKNICKKQMHIIEKSLDKTFSNANKQESGEYTGQGDYDPKAVRDEIYYTINTGEIYLQCVTWGKEAKKREYIFDNLRVSMMNNEFSNWLNSKAY